MRWLMLVLVVAAVGCGRSEPKFRDDAEELRYLQSQANPTVEQFRRRDELRAKAEAASVAADRDAKLAQAERILKIASAYEERDGPKAALIEVREALHECEAYPDSDVYKRADSERRRLEKMTGESSP